jgi:uncharacterized membrane protein
METHLRPMTLGEILDRTAQLYRENFLLFAGIAAVYAGVLLVAGLAETGLQEWLRVAHKTAALLWSTGASVLVTFAVMFFVGGIAVAANNRAVAWLHLGEPATIRGAYRSVLPDTGRYLWLGLIKAFFAWSPLTAIYVGLIATIVGMGMKGLFNPTGAPPAPPVPPAMNGTHMVVFVLAMVAMFVLFIPALVYGILMGLRYALAVPACVVENLPARAAIKRSIVLTKESRGRIFVLWLLVFVIEIVLGMATQSFFIFATVKYHQQLPFWLRVLQQLVGFCTNTFVSPILATGLTLFYYDQRVRKEGYDIEWMMQAAGMTVPLPQAAAVAQEAVAAEAQFGVPAARLEPLPAIDATPDKNAAAIPDPDPGRPGEPAPEPPRESGITHG